MPGAAGALTPNLNDMYDSIMTFISCCMRKAMALRSNV